MSLKEKILIADDSEMNQMLLEEILSDKYEYVMAKDGTEAVDILEKNEDIDLVMLDINMPKMDAVRKCVGQSAAKRKPSISDGRSFRQRVYGDGDELFRIAFAKRG